MAAVGESLAVVSLGMSCQTAEQIRRNVGLLSELAGEELEVKGTPLDWLITSPDGIVSMLDSFEFAPGSVEELEPRDKPYWPKHECYFWHEPAFSHPRAFLSKADHLRKNLRRLGEIGRRVFFFSNTQNNLPRIRETMGGMDFVLTPEGLEKLRGSLRRQFGDHELYVVTYPDRHTLQGVDGVFEIEPDQTDWRGDASKWASIFEQTIGR